MGQDASIKNSYGKYIQNSNVKIVTLSEDHQKALQANSELNSIIIPWHLDVSEFPELPKNTIDILGVGSINTIKNYGDFIDIISALAKTHTNLNVAIIGEGHLQNEIETKIKNLQLEDTITLTGMLPRTEVFQKMAQSKILLHTSMYESFGFVFLEALYSGMHIVSHNVGLAKTAKNWHVCESKIDLIEACSTVLSKEDSQKKRVTLSTENETINAYLSLYHA